LISISKYLEIQNVNIAHNPHTSKFSILKKYQRRGEQYSTLRRYTSKLFFSLAMLSKLLQMPYNTQDRHFLQQEATLNVQFLFDNSILSAVNNGKCWRKVGKRSEVGRKIAYKAESCITSTEK